MMVRCIRCGMVTGESRDQVDGALCAGCAFPATHGPCHRCGQPAQIPVRPHGIAYCVSCWLADQRVTVEAVPA